jgi:hypothetical protein
LGSNEEFSEFSGSDQHYPGPAGGRRTALLLQPERAADVVTVVAEPEGPDGVRVGMNSIDAEEEGEYHWLTYEQI